MFINAASNVNYLHATEFARNHQNKTTDNPINTNIVNGDTVHISDEAYVALSNTTEHSFDGQKMIYDRINSDPKFADEMAKTYAYSIDLKGVKVDDIRHMPSPEELGWSESDRQSFDRQAATVREQRIQIYEKMKANGFDGVDIYKALMDFDKTLPNDYQKTTRIDQLTKYW